MQVQKEKKQVAILIGIFAAGAVLILYGFGYELPFSYMGLQRQLDEQSAAISKLGRSMDNFKKNKMDQARSQEQAKLDAKELENIEAHLLDTDPRLWFIGMFKEDGEQRFQIRLTSYRKGTNLVIPVGMKLPNCQIYTYVTNIEGTFNEIGRFIAFVENKYPFMAVRKTTIRGRGPDTAICEGEIEFRVLTKKEK